MASAIWKAGHSKTKTCNRKPLLSTRSTARDRSQMSLVISRAKLSKADGGGMKPKRNSSHSSCRRGCISGFQRHRRRLVNVCSGSRYVCTVPKWRMDMFPVPIISPCPFTHPLALAYPFQWELRRKTDSNTIHFRHWSKSTLLPQTKCDGDSSHTERFGLLLTPQKRITARRSSLLMVSAHLVGMHHANKRVPVLREILSTEALCKTF